MALPLCSLESRLTSSLHHRQTSINIHPKSSRFATKTKTKIQFSFSISSPNRRFNYISPPKSASVNGVPLANYPEDSPKDCGEKNVKFNERVRSSIDFLRAILPGGSWWRLPDHIDFVMTAKPVTVLRALRRMWELVAEDRWVIFTAFAALILTALSEISIPHFLTASIFSAQSGDILVFHRNVHLLVLLCFTSGIFRLKSCQANEGNIILHSPSSGHILL